MQKRRPRDVQAIVTEAESFDHSLSATYSLKIILRTAQNILTQASRYERQGDLEQTYLFLYRHAQFCIAQVTTHADRKAPEYKQAVTQITRQVKEDLERLEKLKPELEARYNSYLSTQQKVDPRLPSQGTGHDLYQLGKGSGSDARSSQQLDVSGTDANNEREIYNAIAALGARINTHNPVPVIPNDQVEAGRYAYPLVQHHREAIPKVPAKRIGSQSEALPRQAPALPSKTAYPASPFNSNAAADSLRSLATTEGGAPLRPVFLPVELKPLFLSAAAGNTSRNLETCGIICATLLSNALFVSHVIIPQQTSTSDTCDTTDAGDNALFEYVDSHDLLVCGWIHTHPTQTCFLSSRDLHTSAGYQVMLAESIAVVCAPQHEPAYGIFRITDPPGKQIIAQCKAQGLFHPHEQGMLYTDATRPGHVSELEGLQFELVDLRGG